MYSDVYTTRKQNIKYITRMRRVRGKEKKSIEPFLVLLPQFDIFRITHSPFKSFEYLNGNLLKKNLQSVLQKPHKNFEKREVKIKYICIQAQMDSINK
jgi:hypothetical protein